MPIDIDNTDVSNITIDGQNVEEVTADGNVVFNAIPDIEIVNDFESQDGNSVAAAWGPEINVRDDATNTDTWTSNAIAGGASKHLAGNGGGTDYEFYRNTPTQALEFSVVIQVRDNNGQNGDEARSYIGNDSTNRRAMTFELEGNGDFRVNGSTRDSYSVNTAYKMRAYNIDWNNKTFDWEFKRFSSNGVRASDTGEPFSSPNITEIDLVHYGMSNGSPGGGEMRAFYDNIKVRPSP